MRKIRKGCFETNSSSTHSLTLCTEGDYDKWKNGELYYFEEKLVTPEQRDKIIRELIISNKIEDNFEDKILIFKDKIVPYENKTYFKVKESLMTPDVLAEVTDEEINDFLKGCRLDDRPLTYEEYEEHFLGQYEEYRKDITTSSGDKMITFGYYFDEY